MLNRAILIGRLTADPELRYTQQGVAVTTFRVGQSAQVLISEIARLQALLKAHRDMLMRLYQDTVPPRGYCYRCGLRAGAHDENCAMAEVEELLGLAFEGEDGNEWDDE